MKKFRIKINWTIVFWIGIMMIFLWLIAKIAGLIHTPLIVEMIPVFGGLLSLIGIIQSIAKYAHKWDNAVSDIGDMKLDIKDIKHDIHSLDKRVSVLEVGMINLDKRIARIE